MLWHHLPCISMSFKTHENGSTCFNPLTTNFKTLSKWVFWISISGGVFLWFLLVFRELWLGWSVFCVFWRPAVVTQLPTVISEQRFLPNSRVRSTWFLRRSRDRRFYHWVGLRLPNCESSSLLLIPFDHRRGSKMIIITLLPQARTQREAIGVNSSFDPFKNAAYTFL